MSFSFTFDEPVSPPVVSLLKPLATPVKKTTTSDFTFSFETALGQISPSLSVKHLQTREEDGKNGVMQNGTQAISPLASKGVKKVEKVEKVTTVKTGSKVDKSVEKLNVGKKGIGGSMEILQASPNMSGKNKMTEVKLSSQPTSKNSSPMLTGVPKAVQKPTQPSSLLLTPIKSPNSKPISLLDTSLLLAPITSSGFTDSVSSSLFSSSLYDSTASSIFTSSDSNNGILSANSLIASLSIDAHTPIPATSFEFSFVSPKDKSIPKLSSPLSIEVNKKAPHVVPSSAPPRLARRGSVDEIDASKCNLLGKPPSRIPRRESEMVDESRKKVASENAVSNLTRSKSALNQLDVPSSTRVVINATPKAHHFDSLSPISTDSGRRGSFCHVPTKSLIRKGSATSLYSARESERIILSKKYGEFYKQTVKMGDTLYKYSKEGEPQLRFFMVSQDEETLAWGQFSFALLSKEILIDVERVQYGVNHSDRFDKCDYKTDQPWLCFTLQLPHRTVDLKCQNEEQLIPWFMGLQACIPMSPSTLSLGKFLWRKAALKLKVCAVRTRAQVKHMLVDLLLESAGKLRAGTMKTILYPRIKDSWW